MKPALDELKLMAAKKLPNIISPYRNPSTGITTIFWYHIDPRFVEAIKETEWLHICHLLEANMNEFDKVIYANKILIIVAKYLKASIKEVTRFEAINATFEQKLQAMFDCGFLTP